MEVLVKEEVKNLPPIWIDHLKLRDFRNYFAIEVDLNSGVNLVCGANGHGKTSLLEAISLLSTGRLLRGGKESLAIRHGKSEFKVEGKLGESGTTISVSMALGKRKKVELNSLSLPRASDIIGRLPTVSFSASDLEIARGEPAERRQFLDWELAQLYPSYLRQLTIFKRALEQRNSLLRLAQEQFVSDELFDVWESQIADSGTNIRQSREHWIRVLSELSKKHHEYLGGGESLELVYAPKDETKSSDEARALLTSNRKLDIARGSTTTGPHRDDLSILINDTDARHFGSQGQQRTSVIAIKLAVLESACEVLSCQPILLLDDVFSDLDQHRRNRLMELTLNRGGQVFLTCTESEQAGVGLVAQSSCLVVESGRVMNP